MTTLLSPDPHIPPVASAGPDINITLPQSAVVLDGSGSRDDFGIVSYQWVRSKDSPAAGVSTCAVHKSVSCQRAANTLETCDIVFCTLSL